MIQRKTVLTAVASMALIALAAAPAFAVAVGEKAPAFELTDLDGNARSLADYAGKTVVLEWINPNCPFSNRHAEEGTMVELAKEHGEVVWLGINSTNPEHRDFLSREEHAAWAAKHGIEYEILYDESGSVGHAYDAKTTPHMSVIDGEGEVVYNGAIDNDPPGRLSQSDRDNYVDAGLGALEGSHSPDPASTKPYGCSVKY